MSLSGTASTTEVAKLVPCTKEPTTSRLTDCCGCDNPILEVLKPLSDILTTETMAKLNAKVSSDGLPPEQVAETFLKDKGFIK